MNDVSKMTVPDLMEGLENQDLEDTDGNILEMNIFWLELKKRIGVYRTQATTRKTMSQHTIVPPLTAMHSMVERFNRQIIGLEIPECPALLSLPRANFRFGHIGEELSETIEAFNKHDLDGVTDGLLDLIYVALGTLFEMGIPAGAAFEEVHAANMRRERGNKATRPGSLGFDAVKPEGWTPPDLTPYLSVDKADIEYIVSQKDMADEYTGGDPYEEDDEPIVRMTGPDRGALEQANAEPLTGKELRSVVQNMRATSCSDFMKPKILILGHGRHGKDTVAEILRDEYGMKFTSSSMFLAEYLILPAFIGMQDPDVPEYSSVEECYEDRGNHRAFWYETIRDFNRPDASKLGQAIFEKNDIYCGLRSKAEFHALMNSGVIDLVIWVDRSDHVEPEPSTSITVQEWMAQFTIDNNGTLEDLRFNVKQLMENVL